MFAAAALSARSLVELGAQDGLAMVALDLYGDVDTCRIARRWVPIGEAMRIDGARLLAALDELASAGASGWIAGSGFEDDIDLLEEAARRLPLLGTAPANGRRLRDPRTFFGFLDEAGIAHPPVRYDAPIDAAGWLFKGARGCGGMQVWRAGDEPADAASGYWQRERRGATPMSATYIANGSAATLLGCNRQRTQSIGAWPHVFGGVIGPVAVAEPVRRALEFALERLVREFRLRGLGSIDFLLDGGAEASRAEIIEVNARVPASAALYPRLGPPGAGGPLRAHLRACRDGELPAAPQADGLRGIEVVYSRRVLSIDAAAAARLAAAPQLHDVPRAGSRIEAGAPLCTLSAQGDDAASITAELARRREDWLNTLETSA
ncbi:MAG: ATP-grasp domain-containing protein [Burkholderiales bacterium]|nr:ATP-grasp domain-containing protein [Burkholderiales bacterium]